MTKYHVYVVESKNLYGEIEINQEGEFFRIVNGTSTRMYSPLTQCEHHLLLMKRLRDSVSDEVFPRFFTEKYYEDKLTPLIVISNPSCKLNSEKAPEKIREKIIHTDLLTKYIEKHHWGNEKITQQSMENFADFFSHYHRENPRNYLNPYRKLVKNGTYPSEARKIPEKMPEKKPEKKPEKMPESPAIIEKTGGNTTPNCPWCGKPLAIRETKQGKYTGDKFYGCSGFPQCKYSDFSNETKKRLSAL